MQLLGADAHLAPQAELAAIGKAGAGVDIHGRTVHTGGKAGGGDFVAGHDGVAVMGRVPGDVFDGVLQRGHDRHAELVVKVLGVKVGGGGRHAVDDGGGALVQVQFHRRQPGGGAVVDQALFQHRQKGGGHVAVHQQRFLGVADAGAAGLGVVHDVQRHRKVGRGVHIHMADAGAGLDAGHGGVLHTGADQPRPAAGDQQVHQPVGGHQLVGAGVGRVLDQADGALRQVGFAQPGAQRFHNGVAAAPGLAPAAQHAGAAGF